MNVATPTLLVIDDEPPVHEVLRALAGRVGFHVVTAASGEAGIRASKAERADLALIDLRMPDVDGLDVLRAIRDDNPGCQVVLMTGYASVETAVAAIKIGASDYLSKPLDMGRVEYLLNATREQVQRRFQSQRDQLTRHQDSFGMIGTSVAMRSLVSTIHRLAPFARTALLTGETGTGKELAARALHRAGRRSDRRFVTINCSAVVETLFESELFGHVRGAFTGATDTKPGLFEVADGGVLFLDEVGELPLGVQAKLLRVLELGEVHRVGSLEPRKVDVQVIAATNRDLRLEVAAGRFRRDLFYRLNIVEIRLPPLRERIEDIPALANAFARECATRWNKPLKGFTDAAMDRLTKAWWDGNIRELRNVVERACLLAGGTLVTDRELEACLPPGANTPRQDAPVPSLPAMPGTPIIAAPPPVDDSDLPRLSTVERELIVRTLRHARGNKKAAARMLGVSRRALYRRLERLGLGDTVRRRPRMEPEGATPASPASPTM